MIDFRYHLISLMSVLIALTVGIILGAGPLQGQLYETLNNQVERLNEQQTQLSATNERVYQQLTQMDAYALQLGEELNRGLLKDVKVALVSLPGANKKQVEKLSLAFEGAGAQLVSRSELAEFTAKEEAAEKVVQNWAERFRGVKGFVSIPLKEQTAPAEVDSSVLFGDLGELLAVGLGGEDRPVAAQIMQDLVGNGLVHSDSNFELGAGAIVFVGAESPKEEKENYSYLLRGVATLIPNGVELVSTEAGKDNHPTYFDLAFEAGLPLALVGGVESNIGIVNAPLALRASLDGTNGNYGPNAPSGKLLPEVPLPGSQPKRGLKPATDALAVAFPAPTS